MFSMLSNFSHKREMRESKDEILLGDIIAAMARMGYPAFGFKAGSGQQTVRFKPLNDEVLYAISVTIDRKTGGSSLGDALLGSKATIRLQLEIKNFLADPDDLIKMYKTDMQNMFKITALGGIKLNHQLNSVFATKQTYIDINQFLGKEGGIDAIMKLLQENIAEMREKLAPFKKG
ncbi:MAG: hypothetical protein Kow0031_38470 [Anaerolineae bacterium]